MNNARGITILEVVIAMAVLLVLGVMMGLVATVGWQHLARARALAAATSLAQAKMEEVLSRASSKLTNTNGPFPDAPLYTYRVDYQPHPTLSALQEVLVSVLGPLGTQVAYAAILPAGSLTKPVSIPLDPYSQNATIALDRGSNTLYIRILDVNGRVFPGDFKFALGSSKAIGNFSVGAAQGRGIVTFTDSNFSSSPHLCQLFMWGHPSGLCIGAPSSSTIPLSGPCFSTAGTYDISSSPMCRALP